MVPGQGPGGHPPDTSGFHSGLSLASGRTACLCPPFRWPIGWDLFIQLGQRKQLLRDQTGGAGSQGGNWKLPE